MTFNPLTHPNLLYYLPFQSLEPNSYTQGISNDGALADEDVDPVGSIATGISDVTFNASSAAPGTERRVPLGLVGDVLETLGLEGTADRALRHNSTSYANTIHQNRRVWAIAIFVCDPGYTVTRPIIDSTNLANSNATGAQGFTLGTQGFLANTAVAGFFRKKAGSVARVRIKNTSDTPIIDLLTEEDLDAPSAAIHTFVAHIDPDQLCYARIDRGRKAYGRVVGEAGTGNAARGMFLTNRASTDSWNFPGKLIAAGIYSDYPGDAEYQEWLDAFPGGMGEIEGSSEARVEGCHINFSRDQAGMPYCLWFNGRRVSGGSGSGAEEGGNVVLNDGVSADYLNGSAGWCGGPHRNEALNSATVSIDGADPVAYGTGQIYRGRRSVRVVRNTTLGISFDQTETATITRNAHRVNTVLTRKGDSRTINPLYFRTSRDSIYEDFLAFDATGAVVHDGSVTDADFTCDAGVIAVAQWSPTGVLALTTVMKGRALNYTTIIFYSAGASRRIYHRLNAIPTGTDSVEFETLSRFYETDAKSWKTLAAGEVAKLLGAGGSIAWTRDGVDVVAPAELSADPEMAGEDIRTFLSAHEEDILPTDVIRASGTADFGWTHTLRLPSCRYEGVEGGARWLTHTRIDETVVDGEVTKSYGTAGFTFRAFIRFTNFYFGGQCWHAHEDGGLLGWDPAFEGEGVAEFHECEIDASGGQDWGIYSWKPFGTAKRTVKIVDSTLHFCRQGVALCGTSADQTVILTRVRGYGDANGSHSYGWSSSLDYDNGGENVLNVGGVLAAVVNRRGPVTMTDCTIDVKGLDAPYQAKWGCPRLVAWATNQYYGAPGNGSHACYFVRCRATITPGTALATFLHDIRIPSVGTPLVREIRGDASRPASYPGAVVVQPTDRNLCWLGEVGASAHPAATDDLIQNAEMLLGARVLTQPTAAAARPKWRGKGWMWCGFDGVSHRRLTIPGTQALNNHFHVDGTGHFLARIRLDAVNSGFKCVASNCRLVAGNTGFGVRTNSSSQMIFLLYVGGTAILSLNAGPIADTREHTIEFVLAPGVNASKGRIDRGAWVTGTIGTLAAPGTPANDPFTLGCRSSGSADPFNGQIAGLFIASEELPSAAVDDWYARWEPGSQGGARNRVSLGFRDRLAPRLVGR